MNQNNNQNLNNEELTNNLISNFKNNPITDFLNYCQGEKGILKTLFLYEKLEKRNLTPGEIGNIQNLTSGRVATTLKSLEKKFYIERTTDNKDHRKIIVRLTEKGQKVAEKIIEKIKNDVQKLIDKLGEHDAKEYLRILTRLNSK